MLLGRNDLLLLAAPVRILDFDLKFHRNLLFRVVGAVLRLLQWRTDGPARLLNAKRFRIAVSVYRCLELPLL